MADVTGIRVHRVAAASFGRGRVARTVSYASFFAGSMWHALRGPKPDVVLTLTTPPLLSLTGTLCKFLRGAKHVIWEMDVYPDVAVALNLFAPGSSIERVVGALADFSRRRSDAVIVLGTCMRDRLTDRDIPADRLTVAENWVAGPVIEPRPFPRNPPIVVLYSGNLGLAHDLDTIAGAMGRLRDPGRFRFVFTGGGARRLDLERRCNSLGLRNASFLPYQSAAELGEHFGNCHVALVSQHPATTGCVVPSKSYASMSAGRPFVFVGPAEATTALLIDRYRCGWRIQPGDIDALTGLLERMAAEPQMLHEAGARARSAFCGRYHRQAGVSRILSILTVAPLCPAAQE